jgi:hypothetical protein
MVHTVYTTKARLWYQLELRHCGKLYAYVAVECNPPANDPTSNPLTICQEFARLAQGEGSADYRDKWEKQKRTLKGVMELCLGDNLTELARVQRQIANASLADAAPVLLTIRVNDSQLVASTDRRKTDFPDNVEFIIQDIPPSAVSHASEVCECAD